MMRRDDARYRCRLGARCVLGGLLAFSAVGPFAMGAGPGGQESARSDVRPGSRSDRSRPERGPRWRRQGPHRAPPALWDRMSKSEREQVMKFIEEHFPRLYLELDRMRERHPERQTRRMTRIASEVRELIEVMETNPERGALMIQERRLDMEIRHVVFRYRMADEAARAALRKDMRSLCEEIFDVRHRRRELEIRELEARISELKQRHEQASSMRDALVDREVTERLERGAMRPVGARDTRGAPESP